ncbi:phosphate ABC transporter substrate-binding protein [Zooshikella sp. RANM57]|uniref:phosphate ABC transporter substrate-binding protein n=1 Tax=Zooshikella sp. RANM57 TaxID=3425863 RepID=UPI003D6DE2BF
MKKIIVAALFSVQSVLASAEISVIVNPSFSDSIDTGYVKQLFLGKKIAFPSGSQAKLVTIDHSTDIFDEFCFKVIDKPPRKFLSYWSRLVFTGKAAPMIEAKNSSEVKKLVAGNANYIGFIPSGDMDETVKLINKY